MLVYLRVEEMNRLSLRNHSVTPTLSQPRTQWGEHMIQMLLAFHCCPWLDGPLWTDSQHCHGAVKSCWRLQSFSQEAGMRRGNSNFFHWHFSKGIHTGLAEKSFPDCFSLIVKVVRTMSNTLFPAATDSINKHVSKSGFGVHQLYIGTEWGSYP